MRRLGSSDPALVAEIAADFDAIRAELEIPAGFGSDVLAAAEVAAARPLPADLVDRRDVELVTIDPPGSKDLDQALHVAARDGGFRVDYAIADVAAFVARGGPIESEAWRRGVTAYAPDGRTPLYPPAIGEGAASLLPDQDRPAILFGVDLDGHGEIVGARIERALVRSRRQLTYEQAQAESVGALEQVGRLRQALALARGGVQLDLPAQEIVADGTAPAGYRLELAKRLPVEDWNAEISLLTGMVAAQRMLAAGVGLMRTMAGPDPARLEAARRAAPALGVDWPADEPVSALVARLHATDPFEVALLGVLRRAMGHAGYTAIAADAVPGTLLHAAIAAPYAHSTAPIRRLADRYVLDLLIQLDPGGRPTADEVAAFERLPATMAAAEARAGRLERLCVDALEVRLLEARVGETFPAVVVGEGREGAEVYLRDPVVRAVVRGAWPRAGEEVHVRLDAVDPARRRLDLAVVADP